MDDPLDEIYRQIGNQRIGPRVSLGDRLYSNFFSPIYLVCLIFYGGAIVHFETALRVRYGIGTYGMVFGGFLMLLLGHLLTKSLVRSICDIVREQLRE
jgi:hypothetical protein